LHWGAAFLSFGTARAAPTTKLYQYFYKENSGGKRTANIVGELLVQPKKYKGSESFCAGDYLLSGSMENYLKSLSNRREKMLRMGSRISLLSGFRYRNYSRFAYVFVAL
jgi:hypothetical protein